MNKKGHVINAAVLSIGVAILLGPSSAIGLAHSIAVVTPPIVLGALFPDIDTAFGTHRRTFHNLLVLVVAISFPVFFDNLQYVWIGITTHYLLDLLGNVKGMALFYPYPEFYDIPIGVNVTSRWADVVTLTVTGLELAAIATVIKLGYRSQIAEPNITALWVELVTTLG